MRILGPWDPIGRAGASFSGGTLASLGLHGLLFRVENLRMPLCTPAAAELRTTRAYLRTHRFCAGDPSSMHGGSQCALVLVLKLQSFLYCPSISTKQPVILSRVLIPVYLKPRACIVGKQARRISQVRIRPSATRTHIASGQEGGCLDEPGKRGSSLWG